QPSDKSSYSNSSIVHVKSFTAHSSLSVIEHGSPGAHKTEQRGVGNLSRSAFCRAASRLASFVMYQGITYSVDSSRLTSHSSRRLRRGLIQALGFIVVDPSRSGGAQHIHDVLVYNHRSFGSFVLKQNASAFAIVANFPDNRFGIHHP